MKKRWKAWRVHDVRWTKYPLIAFAIVSIGPIAIALYRWGSGSVVWEGVPLLVMLPLYALLALENWPFLALYSVCRQRVREEWPSVRSVRLAMWISLVAMLLANVPFLTAGPNEPIMLIILAGMWWAVPILGLIGWAAGRFIAWIIGLVIGA